MDLVYYDEIDKECTCGATADNALLDEIIVDLKVLSEKNLNEERE